MLQGFQVTIALCFYNKLSYLPSPSQLVFLEALIDINVYYFPTVCIALIKQCCLISTHSSHYVHYNRVLSFP